MLIAVEGCCHGELDKIYDTLQAVEKQQGVKVDLLLMCGDFQAMRDADDLRSLACPPKYKVMGDFEKYYSGEKRAPVLTIFIGGNHEASNYLWENYYGGWVADNIYFLGYSGAVRYKGVVIAGNSGIYKANDYNKGYTERPPYSEGTMRSIYHVRDFEVQKMLAWGVKPDIYLTHDWPLGIYEYGDAKGLVRWKKQFADEVATRTLGSPAAEKIMNHLRPSYHFSSHLHCKFSAVIDWQQESPPSVGVTKFLALDKCLPKRSFLQVLQIEGDATEDTTLYRPTEWLAVLKASNEFFPTTDDAQLTPEKISQLNASVRKHREWVKKRVSNPHGHPVTPWDQSWTTTRSNYTLTDNPQTAELCEFLEIDNKIRSTGAPPVARHLCNTSAAKTHMQLGRIATGISDANRLLDDLLKDDVVPTPSAGFTPGPAPTTAPAPAPAPADDDDEVFPMFVDTN